MDFGYANQTMCPIYPSCVYILHSAGGYHLTSSCEKDHRRHNCAEPAIFYLLWVCSQSLFLFNKLHLSIKNIHAFGASICDICQSVSTLLSLHLLTDNIRPKISKECLLSTSHFTIDLRALIFLVLCLSTFTCSLLKIR